MTDRELLIMTAAVNIPIMNYYHCPVKPLAITEEMADDIKSRAESMGISYSKITLTTNPDEVYHRLHTQNMGFMFVYPQPDVGIAIRSSKKQLMINDILEMTKDGNVNAVVVFVFRKKIPVEYKEILTYFSFDRDSDDRVELNGLPVPRPNQIELVIERYKRIKNQEDNCCDWLFLACATSYAVLLNSHQESLYPRLLQAAESWVQETALFNNDEDQFVGFICDLIGKYVTSLAEMCEMSYTSKYSEEELESKVILKGQYVYFTDNQFKSALREYSSDYEMRTIKEVLRGSGILCTHQPKGFKAQFCYEDIDGINHRTYRLKLDSKGIPFKGKTLYDHIYKKAGGSHDENIYSRYDR